MSLSVLTDLIYSGADTVAGLAENAVNTAITKHGPDRETGFPGTDCFYPVLYGLSGLPVRTLGDLPKGIAYIKSLITNEKNIPLVIFGADCVPVFLLDKKNKAIGMAHCGWMGTGKRMAEKTLQAMMEAFGTDPADVTAAIGPSIGKCCFQVDAPVVNLFKENIAWASTASSFSKAGSPSPEGKSSILHSTMLPILSPSLLTSSILSIIFSSQGPLGA